MSTTPIAVGIACGGTGGHTYPGLATARELERRGHRVVLWLAGRDIESMSVADWKGAAERVRATGLPAGLSVATFVAAWRFVPAIAECRRQLKRHRPDVVLGMGSYASIGPVAAARLLGIPVVLHEANVVPGRAVELLARWAAAVATGFEQTREHLRHPRLVHTGLPLRPEIEAGARAGKNDATSAQWLGEWGLQPERLTVLALGGSQGARPLNQAVPRAVKRLCDKGLPVQVLHISGPKHEAEVRQLYAGLDLPHAVLAYCNRMERAYRVARVAVCRSGAGTCAELEACGLPAVLVPLPSARRDHQTANARALAQSGTAEILAEDRLTPESLAAVLERLLSAGTPGNESRATPMSGSASERLADLLEAVARGG